jgi:6-pyruvoyltetrahydropterin/6-carboxytetrahydropterin synthase
METFIDLERKDLARLTIFDGVGVEKFAQHAYNYADKLVREMTDDRCWVVSVECAEHGANSAIYSI